MNSFRNEIKSNFTAIPNSICNDNRLTWKAKGILLYLASKSDDWKFYMDEIKKNATDGKTALQSGIKELEQFGYLIRERSFDEYNKINGYNWILQIPFNKDCHQTENPTDGKPTRKETPSHNKKEITNTKLTNKEVNKGHPKFNDFYDIYPSQIDQFKTGNYWNNLTVEERELAIKSVEPYKRYLEVSKQTGYAHKPANYLKDKIFLNDWESEIKRLKDAEIKDDGVWDGYDSGGEDD